MFTGIIVAIGRIDSLQAEQNGQRVYIDIGKLDGNDLSLGDSVAVNGVCLTVSEKTAMGFYADVSGETLSRTTAGQWRQGTRVNLELALTPTTRLGGHLVSGHVDGVGKILKRWSDGRSERFIVEAPTKLARYIAEKGSICVDGISLTVNSVDGNTFALNIVPHTLKETTMGDFKINHQVNLEVDIIARYLERLLLGEKILGEKVSGEKAVQGFGAISHEFLKQHGFGD